MFQPFCPHVGKAITMDRVEDIAETKRREGKREDGGRSGELALIEVALPQQDVLSPTLHMSSPILSTRIWTAGVENGSTSVKAQPSQGPASCPRRQATEWLTRTIGQDFGE